jgi:hypothetical protein
MNPKTLSIVLMFLCAPLLLMAQQFFKKLPSGFYNLTNDPGIKLKLDGSTEYYTVDEEMIVSAKHVTSTKTKTVWVNGKSIPALQMTFDAGGMKALNESLNKGAFGKHNIGLVINNKLKTAGWFIGPIRGLNIDLSFGNKYTLEQIQALKVDIDKER